MTNHETAAVDRIPVAHSVVYAVRGLPEIADEYNDARTIAPTEITLTYRSAPDSQLGRVHAYVKGWWMEGGVRVPMDKPVGRHLYGDPEAWPGWLAEEARLHDPEAAVSVPPPAPRADVEAIARVRALHVPDENGNCRDCQASFDPCPTIVAIDGDRTSFGPGEGVYGRDPFYEADVPGPVAGEQQNETPEAVRCGCEWMPKRAAKGA